MISVNNICFSYNTRKNEEILHNVSFEIPEGQFVLLSGESGSGKTTLLKIVAGLLRPDSGDVFFNGESIYNKNNSQLCDFRRDNIGFVFQNFNLEDNFSVEENVLMPLLLKKMSDKERKAKINEILDSVGLLGKAKRKPTELSGGECQRVSIARALVNNPKFIIADEPTGNLDSKNGEQIISIMKDLIKEGKTVLMVSHNEKYIKYADIVIKIQDGNLI